MYIAGSGHPCLGQWSRLYEDLLVANTNCDSTERNRRLKLDFLKSISLVAHVLLKCSCMACSILNDQLTDMQQPSDLPPIGISIDVN